MAITTRRKGQGAKGDAEPPRPSACVAIAATATAQEAVAALFGHLPRDTGASFVLTFRREPELPSAPLWEVVRAASGMPVEAATDQALLEANKIYVARDDQLVTVEAGRLHVGQASPEDGRIDSLLVSVAEAY